MNETSDEKRRRLYNAAIDSLHKLAGSPDDRTAIHKALILLQEQPDDDPPPADEIEWEQKIWGQTRCVGSSPFHSEHELRIKAGHVCSMHHHRKRANRFIVKSGCIRIVRMQGLSLRHTLLESGECADVPSMVAHQFQVLRDGEMTELYYSDRGGEISVDDIERDTEGCAIDIEKLQNTIGIVADGRFIQETNET